MGAAFCTVFESAVPPYGTLGSDSRAILRHRERLYQLAGAAGLVPLVAAGVRE